MRLVLDMYKDDFMKAIKYEDVLESVEFFLNQEYAYTMTIYDFLEKNKNQSVIEICDTIEYDVDKDLARILDSYEIPYSFFVLVDEETESDDLTSIKDAKTCFPDLDIYSEYQHAWV